MEVLSQNSNFEHNESDEQLPMYLSAEEANKENINLYQTQYSKRLRELYLLTEIIDD